MKAESDDVNDAKQGAVLEAACLLLMQQPERALALQDERIRPMMQETELLAQTYQALGDAAKAGRAWQISLYQHVLALVGGAANYLALHAQDREKSEEILRRARRGRPAVPFGSAATRILWRRCI